MIRYNEEKLMIKDNVMVVLENIGEGLFGDYNEYDPEDINLLRFSVYVKSDEFEYYDVEINREYWRSVDDASYCTGIPANTNDEKLNRVLEYLMKEFYNVLHLDTSQSVKRLGESLSWVTV